MTRRKANRVVFLAGLLAVSGCKRALSFDAHGVAQGSGERVYKYKSGEVKLREEYEDSKVVRSRWFKPDGTLVQETRWNDGTGEGLYLRDDGSVRSRMRYAKGVAEGESTEYDDSGIAIARVTYRAGQEVSRQSLSTTR